ncbi:unnamed protein product [Calypogeia fissa]
MLSACCRLVTKLEGPELHSPVASNESHSHRGDMHSMIRFRENGEDKKADGKLKYVSTIDKACSSLCDHRTAITTPQQARRLKHVGDWILKLLLPFFTDGTRAPTQQPASQESLDANMTAVNGKAKKKYIPAKNSGGYALLITLLRAHSNGAEFMKKAKLIDEADKSGLSNKPIRDNAVGWTAGQPNAKDMYSGWSNMTTLIKNNLVVKWSNPAKYKLTDEGKLTAQQCMERAGLPVEDSSGHGVAREEERRVSPSRQDSGKSNSGRQDSSSSDEDVQEIRRSDLNPQQKRRRGNNIQILPAPPVACETRNDLMIGVQELAARGDNMNFPRNNNGHYSMPASQVQGNVTVEIGSIDPDFRLAVPPLEAGEKFSDVYEIICILDNREQFARRKEFNECGDKTELHATKEALMTHSAVKVDIRGLPVGDCLWIARHKEQNEEYVLEFVVERKSVRDLWGSIKDNRYNQQKLKLMNCGLKCLLYLVEGDVNTVESTDALKTAMFTTELQGFRILKTEDTLDTRRQYGYLTQAIIRRYNIEIGKGGNSGPVSKTYKAFLDHCKEIARNRIRDVFCRQLTQIGQVTEEIARSIQRVYPTLISIAEAYEKRDGNQEAQEKLLQGIEINNGPKTISAVMSRNIYKALWASESPSPQVLVIER